MHSLIFGIFLFIFASGIYPLKLASFNIQIYGVTKAKNVPVMEILTKIIRRYDIVFIQEIRSKSSMPFEALVNSINTCNTSSCGKFSDVYVGETSLPYGRSHSKEKYGVIFKPNMVDIEKKISIPLDGKEFERPPLCYLLNAKEKSQKKDTRQFAALAIHIDPDDVSSEMDYLYDASLNCLKETGMQNIVILGDMNADCGYLSGKKRRQLKLRTDTSYVWLISDEADTTVGKSSCSYDRFIVKGNKLLKEILPNSTRVFEFDKEFGLDTKEASLISDHYPIELQIGGRRIGHH